MNGAEQKPGRELTRAEAFFLVAHVAGAISGLAAALGAAAVLLEEGRLTTSRVGTVVGTGTDPAPQPMRNIAKQYFETL